VRHSLADTIGGSLNVVFSNATHTLAFCSPSSLANRALGGLQHIKEMDWTHNYFPTTLERKPFSHHQPLLPPPPPPPFPLLTPSGMAASAVYANQVSAGGYPHIHGHGSTSPPSTPLSPTLVNATRHIERPSIELKISGSGAKIVNAIVADGAGRPLYSISSNSKRTKLLSHKDNIEVATVEWDRSSPRMVFRGKKVKCKDWLPLAGPDTE
jgi:hypothetical protein